MVTSLRAAVSVAMLAGFYVIAFGVLAGLGWLTVFAFEDGQGSGGVRLGIFTVLIAIGLVTALWKVARAQPTPDPGLVLAPADAPELWGVVRELADAAQTRVPDEIRLVGDVNAAVSEDARLLGLVGGKRHLYLGVPLLQAFDVAQLRSVLAHELGHYSHSHTRLAAVTYRGQSVILATVAQLSGNVVGWLLKGYARLYLLVSAAVSRRQELEADELSVRIAGRDVAQSTLRDLPVVDTAWNFYTGAYLSNAWESGYAPTAPGFFGGFGQMLGARASELDELRADAPPSDASRWDSHPPVAVRIAAMEHVSDPRPPRDTRPATVLVPDFATAAAAVAEEIVAFDARTRLDWDDLTATSVALQQQRAADSAYRAAARLAGQGRGTLATVLDLAAAGRAGELAHAVGLDTHAAPDDEQPVPVLMSVVLGSAAVQVGAARWQHSWDGPAVLVGRDGRPLDVEVLAAQAADPAQVPVVREQLARLGIEPSAAGQASVTATAHGGEILGGIANMDVDGVQHDVVVLDNGLLLVPCPKTTEGGKLRLAAVLRSAPVVELAARYRFLPFEEVASAQVLKRGPVRVSFTLHDGSTVVLKEKWTGDRLTKDSDEILVGMAEQLAGTSTQTP